MKTVIKLLEKITIGVILIIGLINHSFADNIQNFSKNKDLENTIYNLNLNNLINFTIKNNDLYFNNKKLVNINIIDGITNIKEFLQVLSDDKKYLSSDSDNLFIELKEITLKLTNGLEENKKIKNIYKYILENISYSQVFDLKNKKIFSGIDTFENKVGLCGGYSKLFLYMLSFAGIKDVEYITGKVINADNFQNIGHAWIRIGELYYDITFDDPIGNKKTKSFQDYKYFGLPKDIFYADRFDKGNTPEYLLNISLEDRENLIKNNLISLIEKYEDKNYNLLKEFIFRKNNNISYNETITTEKLKDIIPYYEVKNYKFNDGKKIVKINNLKYYQVSENNIEKLLKQLNYDLDGYNLYKWDDGNYRLSYYSKNNEIVYK